MKEGALTQESFREYLLVPKVTCEMLLGENRVTAFTEPVI